MSLNNIRIVLSSPAYGGNVGSVCRAMMNMGLSRLYIANNRNNLFEEDTRKMALKAVSIYENRVETETVAEAVADCGVVAATSARTGLYRAHARTPREWAPDLLAEAARGGQVALVFGNEISGLDNEDLKLANRIIQIPSTAAYSSLNLSQAVMVCAYELYSRIDDFEPQEERSPEAPSQLREKMYELWGNTMLDIGFANEDKAEHMIFGLRRILSRSYLSEKDVKILMGLARQAQWAANNNPEE